MDGGKNKNNQKKKNKKNKNKNSNLLNSSETIPKVEDLEKNLDEVKVEIDGEVKDKSDSEEINVISTVSELHPGKAQLNQKESLDHQEPIKDTIVTDPIIKDITESPEINNLNLTLNSQAEETNESTAKEINKENTVSLNSDDKIVENDTKVEKEEIEVKNIQDENNRENEKIEDEDLNSKKEDNKIIKENEINQQENKHNNLKSENDVKDDEKKTSAEKSENIDSSHLKSDTETNKENSIVEKEIEEPEKGESLKTTESELKVSDKEHKLEESEKNEKIKLKCDVKVVVQVAETESNDKVLVKDVEVDISEESINQIKISQELKEDHSLLNKEEVEKKEEKENKMNDDDDFYSKEQNKHTDTLTINIREVNKELVNNKTYANKDGVVIKYNYKEGQDLKHINKDYLYIANLTNGSFTYTGLLNDKFERNGFGKNTHSNGDVYLGSWIENKKQAQGVYIHKAEDEEVQAYNGFWENGVKRRLGVYTWKKSLDNHVTSFDTFVGKFEEGIYSQGLYITYKTEMENVKRFFYLGEFNKDGKKFDKKAFYFMAHSQKLFYGFVSDNELVNGEVMKVNSDQVSIDEDHIFSFDKNDKSDVLNKNIQLKEEEVKQCSEKASKFLTLIKSIDFYNRALKLSDDSAQFAAKFNLCDQFVDQEAFAKEFNSLSCVDLTEPIATWFSTNLNK